MKQEKRIHWIDVLRGIAILLVMVVHTQNSINKYICGFIIPLFFFISGYVRKDAKQIRIGYYFRKFIIPYFILCGINLIIWVPVKLFQGENIGIIWKYIFAILYSLGTKKWMPNCSPLWFLTAIFTSSILFDSFDILAAKSKRKIILPFFVTLCGSLAFILDYYDFPKLPWNLDSAMVGVMFMYFGYIVRKKDLISKVKTWFSILLVPVSLYLITLNPINKVLFNYNIYGNPILMLAGAAGMVLGLTLIVKRFTVSETAIYKTFTYLGHHTLFIMAFDYLSRSICVQFFHIKESDWVLVLIGKIMVLCIGYAVWTLIVSRINNDRVRSLLTF